MRAARTTGTPTAGTRAATSTRTARATTFRTATAEPRTTGPAFRAARGRAKLARASWRGTELTGAFSGRRSFGSAAVAPASRSWATIAAVAALWPGSADGAAERLHERSGFALLLIVELAVGVGVELSDGRLLGFRERRPGVGGAFGGFVVRHRRSRQCGRQQHGGCELH